MHWRCNIAATFSIFAVSWCARPPAQRKSSNPKFQKTAASILEFRTRQLFKGWGQAHEAFPPPGFLGQLLAVEIQARRTCTARASCISRRAVKSGCARGRGA